MLGHVKLETTAIYTHVCIAELIEAHRRFHPADKSSEPSSTRAGREPTNDGIQALTDNNLAKFTIRLEALGKELAQLRSVLLARNRAV